MEYFVAYIAIGVGMAFLERFILYGRPIKISGYIMIISIWPVGACLHLVGPIYKLLGFLEKEF